MFSLAVVLAWTLGVASERAPAAQERALVVATNRFELRSDPRVALHHFLVDWASADAGEWPRYALPLTERSDWMSGMDEQEQSTWMMAVEAYGGAVGRSLLFDEGMLATRAWAAGAGPKAAIPEADRRLADAVERALPVFERHVWPEQDEKNRAWISSVTPTLRAVEEAMIARFEEAYGGSWPDELVPIDVMVYANAVGAYSSSGRLTISSVPLGNQMPQAIEMIFHEASHTDELEGPLREELSRAFRAAGAEEPERFWHDVIFFTSGEIARLVLAEHGHRDYQHYGTLGVYRRGARWREALPAFEANWRSFLESSSREDAARRDALKALIAELFDNNQE